MNTAHDFCILFINKKYEPARLEGKEWLDSGQIRTAIQLKIKMDYSSYVLLS